MIELNLEESLILFMAEIAKRHDENSNLIKEIQASTDFALKNQQALIKALEIQVKKMSIILHRALSRNLQSLTKTKPRGNDETTSTSVKDYKPSIRCIDASQYEETDEEKDLEAHYTNVKPLGKALPRKEKDPGSIDKFTFPIDFIIFDIPEDFKTPLILGRPFLSTAHAIINVFKAKITLSVGKETRLMGNELRNNKLQDPNFKDFIELNDPNEPIEHRKNQVKVFVPTINEDRVLAVQRIHEYDTAYSPD
ncbi:homeodomain-like protein [Tanacetum coccineum]